MALPVEVENREDYKRKMRALLRLDPAHTAMLTIDMQRDYLDPEVATAPVRPEAGRQTVASTVRLLAACRAAGIPVVHCYVSRRPIEAEHEFYSTAYGRAGRAAGLSQNPTAASRVDVDRVSGTPNAEVMPALVAPGDTHLAGKRQMDSFYGTDLDVLLRDMFDVRTLLLAGINTDTCVYATAFGVAHRGYAPVVVSDCVASMRGDDHHWMALELMSRTMAWVLNLDEAIAAIGPAGAAAS